MASHIVMSANYPAAPTGCPELELLGHHADEPIEASAALMALFRRQAPGGARLDGGGVPRSGSADPTELARTVRAAADTELGLPVTVGVGRTRLMAKLASRRAKPDGLLVADGAAV